MPWPGVISCWVVVCFVSCCTGCCRYDNGIAPANLSARGQDSTCHSALPLIYLAEKIDSRENHQIQFTKLLRVISTFRNHVICFQNMSLNMALQILHQNTSLLRSVFTPNKYLRNVCLGRTWWRSSAAVLQTGIFPADLLFQPGHSRFLLIVTSPESWNSWLIFPWALALFPFSLWALLSQQSS